MLLSTNLIINQPLKFIERVPFYRENSRVLQRCSCNEAYTVSAAVTVPLVLCHPASGLARRRCRQVGSRRGSHGNSVMVTRNSTLHHEEVRFCGILLSFFRRILYSHGGECEDGCLLDSSLVDAYQCFRGHCCNHHQVMSDAGTAKFCGCNTSNSNNLSLV